MSTIKVNTIQDSGGNVIFSSNGSGTFTSNLGGGGTTWTVKTSSFTASNGDGALIDTTSSAITMTLPSSATLGDQISFVDYAGNSATNNITVARNNHKIQGLTQDLTIDTDRAGNTLVYSGSAHGWLLVNN